MIIRRECPYTMIYNPIFLDENTTLELKGFICYLLYLLEKKEKITYSDVISNLKITEKKFESLKKKAMKSGYIKISENGTFEISENKFSKEVLT